MMLLSAWWIGNLSPAGSVPAANGLESLGAASAQSVPDVGLVAASLAFLVPAGLIMIAIGASHESEVPHVAAVGIASVALAVLVYSFVGFGLQFGGLGLFSDIGGAESLRAEWSPLDVALGPGWGIVGLDGFLLREGLFDQQVLTVIFYHAALAATAVCVPMLALARRFGYLALGGLGLLFALVVYPLCGNWVWGGGFLSQLGTTVGVGHGLVDYAGSGTVHALGAFYALAVVLALGRRKQASDLSSGLPPARFPLWAVLGALLFMVGWFGVLVGNPLTGEEIPHVQVLFNALLAASAGALTSSFYVWLVAGSADLLMVARGLMAALVAISASSPFVAPWAATAIGALAGLFVPLASYVLEIRLRLDNPAVAMAVHGVPGLWGLLALGVFADGSAGQGWNGVGALQYLDVPGQGVSGLLVRSAFQPDWPGQLVAQMAGVFALAALTLLLSWALLRVASGVWRRATAVKAELAVEAEPDREARPTQENEDPQSPSL